MTSQEKVGSFHGQSLCNRAIWKHRNYLTRSGSYIAHQHLVFKLSDAVHLPKVIAVCKSDPNSLENASADTVAKRAAQDDRSPEAHCVQTNTTPYFQVSELQA